jgi:hypothetical protein
MSGIATVVDCLAPIDLASLNAAAALQTRIDRKYVVTGELLPEIVPPDAMVLEIDGRRAVQYESLYFDTDDFVSYRSALHRRRRRFKIRTRRYGDDDVVLLEVKTKGLRGVTIKRRIALEGDARDRLEGDAALFVDDTLGRPGFASTVRPVMRTGYVRTTLFDARSDARITIDVGLRCAAPEREWRDLGPDVVVETKTRGPAASLDHALWQIGVRPVAMSKFAVAMATTHRDLPANKWARVIRHHFAGSASGSDQDLALSA